MVFRDWPVLFDKIYFSKTVRFVVNKSINNELSFINVDLVCTHLFRDKGSFCLVYISIKMHGTSDEFNGNPDDINSVHQSMIILSTFPIHCRY